MESVQSIFEQSSRFIFLFIPAHLPIACKHDLMFDIFSTKRSFGFTDGSTGQDNHTPFFTCGISTPCCQLIFISLTQIKLPPTRSQNESNLILSDIGHQSMFQDYPLSQGMDVRLLASPLIILNACGSGVLGWSIGS